MSYYMTIYLSDRPAVEVSEPYEDLDEAITSLFYHDLCEPPQSHKTNAHLVLDKHGVRVLAISRQTAGDAVPLNIQQILIRRQDEQQRVAAIHLQKATKQ